MAKPRDGLKQALAGSLLSFPVTHFSVDGEFDEAHYRDHIARLLGYGPAGLFAAGGTGEFFSLTLGEFKRVVAAAVQEARGRVPVIAGTGYGTRLAVEFAETAQAAGADGVLVLPPYLLHVEQSGLYQHISSVCRAIDPGFPI